MISAIITEAGKGTWLKCDISKQFLKIYGKPILAHTIKSFQECPVIDEIYVVVPLGQKDFCRKEIINKYNFTKVRKIVIGGNTRQESVYNALTELPKNCRIISVHDGVRPLITKDEIAMQVEDLIANNSKDIMVKGIITAAPAYETVKKIDEENNINTTIERSMVCMAQTPQTFFYDVLINAYENAIKENFNGTDDASLVERMGWKVKVIIGHHENIKITTPMDLFLAELIMQRNGKNK